MFSRTAARVTRFTQSCRFGAFYWSIHIRPPISYLLLLMRPSYGGWGGGRGFLFPCSPEIFQHFRLFPGLKNLNFLFSMFPSAQNYIGSPVTFIFRLVFPCSPEINCFTPLIPITPGRASFIYNFSNFLSFLCFCLFIRCL